MTTAVNAALTLRRPLLLTGGPGTGKSSLIESVAGQLRLGPVLRWPITSRSTVSDALYRYDAIGRLHAAQLREGSSRIGDHLRLGPLGTALAPSDRPRALLIDEIDRGDPDLPGDLLNIFERGEFEISELARLKTAAPVYIRHWGSDDRAEIVCGRVACTQFPFVVLTSNGEREFPPAFLRRCIRFSMPEPDAEHLAAIVGAQLGDVGAAELAELIETFQRRAAGPGAILAVDQLLNAIYALTNQNPDPAEAQRITDLVLRDLNSRTT